MVDSHKGLDKVTYGILFFIIISGGLCYLLTQVVHGYQIPYEADKKSWCMTYSCMLADHINTRTDDTANVILVEMASTNVRHGMVLVNHKKPNCYVIESTTGAEYHTKQELQGKLGKYRIIQIYRTPPYAFAEQMRKKYAGLNRRK